MILQALTAYYERLTEQGKIASPGWNLEKVSYALELSPQGELEQVICVKVEEARGKKKAIVPRQMVLPAHVKRSSGVSANFLCDNSSYILGFDGKGKPKRSRECFEACKTLHEDVLAGADSPVARAILGFFEKWDPETAREHPGLQEYLEDILTGANLTFWVDGQFAQEDPAVRAAWNHCASRTDGEEPEMICLITGEKGPVSAVHPAVKGVAGAQATGAALVSFNAPAFCSYGREQNLNAPVSKQAAFAYTAALNYLLADREHVQRVGDTSVVFWAESGEEAYQDVVGGSIFGDFYEERELRDAFETLCDGKPVEFEDAMLDPDMNFYILGLAPNSARISVRFFLRNTFGNFLKNVQSHYERMEIVRPSFDCEKPLSLWKLLNETVNPNSRDKAAAPDLAGETLRAILMNTRYPATLLNGVELRIRADRDMNWRRAAIIKAYYTKFEHKDIPEKEVLTVSLNPDSTNIPYNLGRLFSVLEAIQSTANPGINTTIKDRYFSSASATPAHVFPVLVNLAQKHLKKIDGGLNVNYNKQLNEIMDKLGENYPVHLNLPQQGAFQLGYYHQTQKRYEKKEEK